MRAGTSVLSEIRVRISGRGPRAGVGTFAFREAKDFGPEGTPLFRGRGGGGPTRPVRATFPPIAIHATQYLLRRRASLGKGQAFCYDVGSSD